MAKHQLFLFCSHFHIVMELPQLNTRKMSSIFKPNHYMIYLAASTSLTPCSSSTAALLHGGGAAVRARRLPRGRGSVRGGAGGVFQGGRGVQGPLPVAAEVRGLRLPALPLQLARSRVRWTSDDAHIHTPDVSLDSTVASLMVIKICLINKLMTATMKRVIALQGDRLKASWYLAFYEKD